MPSEPHPNFVVYKARPVERTYYVASTSAIRAGHDRPVYFQHFDGTRALEQLAEALTQESKRNGGLPVTVTLKVHGYNTRRKHFEEEVLTDADPTLRQRLFGKGKPPAGSDPAAEAFRSGSRFYIGFRWPSEGMLSRGSLKDSFTALVRTPMIGLYLILLPVLALLWLRSLEPFLSECVPWLAWLLAPMIAWGEGLWAAFRTGSPPVGEALRVLLTPYQTVWIAATLFGCGLLLLLLRLSTYPRDRYRALHYGVPDLGEFLRALEERLYPANVKLDLDVIGHSMGTLVLINAFRVMSDFFHAPLTPDDGAIGRNGTYRLRTMVLCAPDLPAVMATPDRNNYFLSALRRFKAMHVFCSDRDIILKWLSSLANWISEPRHDMAGRRLGNVLLVRDRPSNLGRPDSRSDWELCPVTRPVMRHFHVYPHDPLISSGHPADLHFHDCSRAPSLAGADMLQLGITLGLIAVLAWLSACVCQGLFRWLLALAVVFLLVGCLCRFLWPWARDRKNLRGMVGYFGDWPTILMFLTAGMGWNPHSGYFMFHHPPRRRIAEILRNPAALPPRDAQGKEIEEVDGAIRYRRVRVSV